MWIVSRCQHMWEAECRLVPISIMMGTAFSFHLSGLLFLKLVQVYCLSRKRGPFLFYSVVVMVL